jgi:hypothetical protein
MLDGFIALIVDEATWFPISLGLALASVSILLIRHRQSDLAVRRRITAAMNLFFGVTIATMAFGHLSAVTTKLTLGTLRASLSVPLLYAIGTLLAVPSAVLIHHAVRLVNTDRDHGRRTVVLNAWLAITLLALGIVNLPLAVPAFFNTGYQLHSRKAVGWAIVGLAVALNVGLFIASLVFLASGQTFEQFSGLE